MDRDLVKLLLSDREIKAKFFDEIDGHWIFNLNTFLEYISQKNFLDNSYTPFRNRTGLTIGEKYLRERGEVALVWPYKDTVLEGGQTKEEERRKEIFFNEVLAQDEITRLLDPKVLTNFRRYTARPVIASREAAKQSPRKSETASGLDTAEERRLLDPRSNIQVVEEKVTDFRRDENGVIWENLILKGNNLLALHTRSKRSFAAG
jgi:adenine-specific DNA-methyltransferase